MSTDPNMIRYDIEKTRVELGEDVDALADKVNPQKIAQRQTNKVKSAFTGVRNRLMGTADEVRRSGASAASSVGDAVSDAPRIVARKTQGNPLAMGLIAFGVGWLTSSLLPATDPERKAAAKAREAAEPLAEEVMGAAKEAAEHLREPAKEAAAAVKDTATEAAGVMKEEGAATASELKEQKKQPRDTVEI